MTTAEAPPFDPRELNGLRVKRVENVLLIALPRALWRPMSDADPETGLGPCCCSYCSPDKSSRMAAAWDTLAVRIRPERGSADHTWTVHAPEIHGKPRLK